MDYVVGSVAALITGNVTPNRPKFLKRALTPTKHQPSPNVTPKSELVGDRSIFLSPTVQKKKAVVKKSPKRIFENPDLDVTNDGEGSTKSKSPRGEKVKKHLEEDLEHDISPKSLRNKGPSIKDVQFLSTEDEKNDISGSPQVQNESTPKKKKKKQSFVIEPIDNIDQNKNKSISPKKNKKDRNKAFVETNVDKENDINNTNEAQNNKTETSDTEESSNVTNQGNFLNNKESNNPQKRKRKNKKEKKINNITENIDTSIPNTKIKSNTSTKKKNKTVVITNNKTNRHSEHNSDDEIDSEDEQNEELDTGSAEETSTKEDNILDNNKAKPQKRQIKNKTQKKLNNISENTDAAISDTQMKSITISKKKKKTIVNPNAITNKDSDSEHESDDEIDSEDEQNEEIDTSPVEESSEDEEADKKENTQKKENIQKKEVIVNTEEEVKRTVFVGNVPFSPKCKKEIKKIFSIYGQIETIRIRTVPVKDGRATPKIAVIKNELHPDRSTVNVYIKYRDASSVSEALAENGTVLNNHHLRVTRSDCTGSEHDPKCSVFIGNLPFALEDEALIEKFQQCGEIESVRIIRDKKTSAGKGFGYVNFKSKDAVELALALSEEELTIKNRILRVKRCTQTTKQPPQENRRGSFHGRGRGNTRGGFGRGNTHGGFARSHDQVGFDRGSARGGFGRGSTRGGFDRGGVRGGFGRENTRGGFGRGNTRGGFGRGSSRGSFDRVGGRGGFGRGNMQGREQFGRGDKRVDRPYNDSKADGAMRRLMNKRSNQDGGVGPPNKMQKTNQPGKKQRKEFVGMTAEKKKKNKFDKGQKKKKALSEILTK